MLFTFPSRYWFTIGHRVVFSLGRWASLIPTGFPVTRSNWGQNPGRLASFVYRAITFYGRPFQNRSTRNKLCNFPAGAHARPVLPHDTAQTTRVRFNVRTVWAVPVSLAATQGIAFCFLFLGVLRCFTSPGIASTAYFIQPQMTGHYPCRVSPFGHLRI